jgi:hypothetical protein
MVSTTVVLSGNWTPRFLGATKSGPNKNKKEATIAAKSAKIHPLTLFVDLIVIRESPRTAQFAWLCRDGSTDGLAERLMSPLVLSFSTFNPPTMKTLWNEFAQYSQTRYPPVTPR